MKTHRILSAAALALGLAAAAPHAAFAEDGYPSRQVRMVVPFPPGGSVDYIARIVIPEFAKKLGTNVFIENKGGASGAIGTADVARADPDGYTLLMVFDTHAVNPHINKSLPYDTFESFDYITGMTSAPMVLATRKDFPAESLSGLIDYARKNPDKVTYGSSGVGGSNHLTALAFSKAAKASTLHVPYKGGGPMLTAVIGGEVDFVVTTFPLVVERIKAGQLKALGMGSTERVKQLPDVPTVSEQLPGYTATSWIGLVGPAGLKPDVAKKINEAMRDALNSPEVKDRLTGEGFAIMAGTPEAFKTWVKERYAEAEQLIKVEKIAMN
ncbi:tripartite tricarboxylate transporter substrate binding protein [Pusillimonas sp. TS35]|uniref:Bug family tripartite tricarboxylate transporter substrate binding protein n=1 Tax=Paracandidimonas lactea TaxID=2895524 RepID=UPI00136AFDC9|nr:tripartite tricarboxylate transporter substrate binding protein [Paracandidimonas lactea]MYN13859.1 tripartite tricarboxylate transporter substrate binding protein [Pusillimonas sp. TS35]